MIGSRESSKRRKCRATSPVTERGKQLFGESGASAVADEMEAASNGNPQLSLFPEEAPTVRGRARRRQRLASTTIGDSELTLSATTLDRVHAAMLLQASGRSQALRNLLRAEQERGPDSCGSPTPSPPSTPAAVRRSGSWTQCYWRRLGRGESRMMILRESDR